MIYIIQSIKADLFRLRKSKSIVIMSVVILLFIGILISTKSLGTVGVLNEQTMSSLDGFKETVWTADVTATAMLSQITILMYFLIVIPVVVIGADFKNKSYKNVITTGISRTQYFIAKALTILIASFIFSVLFISISTILAGLLNGWGNIFEMQFCGHLLKIFIMKFFFVYATLLIGVVFACLTQNTIVMALSIIFVPIIIQFLILMFNLGDTFIKYLDLSSATSVVGVLTTVDTIPYLMGAVTLIGVLSIISLEVFKHSDL